MLRRHGTIWAGRHDGDRFRFAWSEVGMLMAKKDTFL